MNYEAIFIIKVIKDTFVINIVFAIKVSLNSSFV